MPPAIDSDESDVEEQISEPVAPKSTRGRKPGKVKDDMDDEPPHVNGDIEADDDEQQPEDEDEDEGEEGEEGEEEVYVVEKILNHRIDPKDGEPRFKVKWEGWDRVEDLTWEPEENLKESASEILADYYASIGGREMLFEETTKALKTKKRGRPSAGGTPNPTIKKTRRDELAERDPPRTVAEAPWKPPAGSWEDHIAQLDAAEDEATGKLMVYLTWKDGHKTQHETQTIYKRCPQRMLHYYENHVRIVRAAPRDDSDAALKEEE